MVIAGLKWEKKMKSVASKWFLSFVVFISADLRARSENRMEIFVQYSLAACITWLLIAKPNNFSSNSHAVYYTVGGNAPGHIARILWQSFNCFSTWLTLKVSIILLVATKYMNALLLTKPATNCVVCSCFLLLSSI